MKYTDTFVNEYKWDGNILIEIQLEEMKTQQNVHTWKRRADIWCQGKSEAYN